MHKAATGIMQVSVLTTALKIIAGNGSYSKASVSKTNAGSAWKSRPPSRVVLDDACLQKNLYIKKHVHVLGSHCMSVNVAKHAPGAFFCKGFRDASLIAELLKKV